MCTSLCMCVDVSSQVEIRDAEDQETECRRAYQKRGDQVGLEGRQPQVRTEGGGEAQAIGYGKLEGVECRSVRVVRVI